LRPRGGEVVGPEAATHRPSRRLGEVGPPETVRAVRAWLSAAGRRCRNARVHRHGATAGGRETLEAAEEMLERRRILRLAAPGRKPPAHAISAVAAPVMQNPAERLSLSFRHRPLRAPVNAATETSSAEYGLPA
jgi:hypothetical protein